MAEGPTQIANAEAAASRDDRLLALEIRPKKAGFAVLDGASLHDWGVTRYGQATPPSKRIASLLDLHMPSIILMRQRPRMKNDKTVASIVKSITSEAKARSIQIQPLAAHQVRAFFNQRGHRNKHAVAIRLAGWFPELAWKVPPKRKLWQSEPHNTLLFDAVATAVTFLTRDTLADKL